MNKYFNLFFIFNIVSLRTIKKNALYLCLSLLYSFLLQLSVVVTANSQSILNYQSGTSIEVQSGASVCADSVIISGTFSGGGTICGFYYTANISVLIQGFYYPASDIMIQDTVSAYLRDSLSPYGIIDYAKAYLSPEGDGVFLFLNALNGVSYYIQIKHRNSIETWSKTTQVFSSGSLNYDFTALAIQAFGDNMIQVDSVPDKFAVYNGDVNQDGVVDATDNGAIDNDAANFATGYLITDLTGDEVIDASDAAIGDNNAANFVSAVSP